MSNSQKVKFDMSSCLSSPVDLRDEENCIVRSHGFWNFSTLPILLLVARLFPCYTQDSLPLRCQSVLERSFGGLEPLCVQRNGPLASDSAVTSSFGNVFDSSFNSRTGFLANDPCLLLFIGNSRRKEVSQRDEYLTILSIFSSIAWISTELYFWLGMLSWKYSRLRYHCPQAGLVGGKVNGAFTGVERAKRHASRIISE